MKLDRKKPGNLKRLVLGQPARVLRDIYRLVHDTGNRELYVSKNATGEVLEFFKSTSAGNPAEAVLHVKVRIDGAIKTLRQTSLERVPAATLALKPRRPAFTRPRLTGKR